MGDDCGTRFLRPCSHRYRNRQDPYGVPVHNLDNVTKEDRDWTVPGWTAARCGGGLRGGGTGGGYVLCASAWACCLHVAWLDLYSHIDLEGAWAA